ncbi:MAG TPA: glutaredoxin domain-containing protein [Thermodesulfobacteriota bacterium]|nr:glutaredoxin domain-containing protein [Thermodesulfobacteriota bacterium]
MRRIIPILLLLIILSPVSSVVSGEIYQWKDKDGNVVFSDTPPPPGVNAEIKEFKEDTTERPRAKEYPQKPKKEALKEKRPYGDIQVIMYMTSWCPYCTKARNYLHSLNVHLIEYNIERDNNRKEEMLSKSGGSTGVPLIDVEGTIIRGYNPDALKTAIERRRSL